MCPNSQVTEYFNMILRYCFFLFCLHTCVLVVMADTTSHKEVLFSFMIVYF